MKSDFVKEFLKKKKEKIFSLNKKKQKMQHLYYHNRECVFLKLICFFTHLKTKIWKRYLYYFCNIISIS